ncbi:MAG: glycosyltransferase [Desulfovibrionaceae bacterium]
MTRPLTIAYVIGGLPFGGVENWLFDLARALRADPDVHARILNVSGTGVKMDDFRAEGLEVLCAGDSKKALKTGNLKTLRRVRAILREVRPDIVHTLQFSGDYFGRLGAWGLGAPVITHIRNVKSERHLRRRVINRLLSFRTDLYLSVSKAAVATIQREHNLARRPVQVLYNAVDPAKLAVPPVDFAARHGLRGPVVLGVGRLVAQKNFDLLLRAVRLLLDRGQEVSACLVGDGGERERLEGLAAELGLGGRVAFAGYVPNAEVPGYLRAAAVLCMPSDYEGLPVTHVEALFCGLPAVISDRVPSAEIAGAASLICRREPADIADRLAALLGDPARRAEFSAAALAIAPEYAMDRYVERLKAVYRGLVSGS